MRACVLACAAGCLLGAEVPDFHQVIEPILSKYCYECHGETKKKGKLRLDTIDGLTKGGRGGAVISPGHGADSELYVRVTLPVDDDDLMPPEGAPIPTEAIAALKAWIDGGAVIGEKQLSAAEREREKPFAAPATEWDHEAVGLSPIKAKPVAALRQRGFLVEARAAAELLIAVDGGTAEKPITDADLELLAPIADRIVELDLADTAVTDQGLAVLQGCTRLRRLHLERTAITDKGLAVVALIRSLRWLNCHATTITDAGLAQLKDLAELERFFSYGSQVTDAGLAALHDALPKLR